MTPELDFRLCGVYGDVFVLLGGTKGDVQHIYSNIHVHRTGSFLTVTCAFSQEALSDPSVCGGRSGRSNLPTCWGSCRNSHSRALLLPPASSGKCLRSSSMRLEMQSASLLLHFLSLDKKEPSNTRRSLPNLMSNSSLIGGAWISSLREANSHDLYA